MDCGVSSCQVLPLYITCDRQLLLRLGKLPVKALLWSIAMSSLSASTSATAAARVLLSYEWRALDFCLTLFGNVPLGQHFVHITLMAVHDRGWHPTVNELTAITGLTRPSVSRHLKVLMGAGLVRGEIDSEDRRRKILRPTRSGEQKRRELLDALTRLHGRVVELTARGPGVGEMDVKTVQALAGIAQPVRPDANGDTRKAKTQASQRGKRVRSAGRQPGRGA